MSFNEKDVANNVIKAHYEETGDDLLDAPKDMIPLILSRHFHEKTELEYYSVLTHLLRLKENTNSRKSNSVKSDL